MIVAFSTSSALASVALIAPNGSIIAAGDEHAPMGASGACLELLERLLAEQDRALSEAEMFLADLGPGSFTGVKVGVTLAKTFGFAQSAVCGGLPSFDLISVDKTVVLPSKKGEWFVRSVRAEPIRTTELPTEPFLGFGPGIENPTYPHAARFSGLLARVTPVKPELLVPEYLIEPAISVPKKPFAINN